MNAPISKPLNDPTLQPATDETPTSTAPITETSKPSTTHPATAVTSIFSTVDSNAPIIKNLNATTIQPATAESTKLSAAVDSNAHTIEYATAKSTTMITHVNLNVLTSEHETAKMGTTDNVIDMDFVTALEHTVDENSVGNTLVVYKDVILIGDHINKQDGKNKDGKLLIWTGKAVEEAAEGVDLIQGKGTQLDEKHVACDEVTITRLQQHTSQGSHPIITVWFWIDDLIDLWMHWISQKESTSQSAAHFFSKLFYTTLLNEGADGVSKWTTNKGINAFSKKVIFIPENIDIHWSLMAVCSPLMASVVVDVHEDEPDDLSGPH